MLFVEVSAKTNDGINEVFDELITRFVDSPLLLVQTGPTNKRRGGGRDAELGDVSHAEESSCC